MNVKLKGRHSSLGDCFKDGGGGPKGKYDWLVNQEDNKPFAGRLRAALTPHSDGRCNISIVGSCGVFIQIQKHGHTQRMRPD